MGELSADQPIQALTAAAAECAAVRGAAALAEWVGSAGRGRQLSAAGALRRPDVPELGRVLGVDVPSKVRSVADLPQVQGAWAAALALGLLCRDGTRVRAVPGAALPGETDPAWPALWLDALVGAFGEAVRGAERQEAVGYAVGLLDAIGTAPEPMSAWQVKNVRYRIGWREPGYRFSELLRQPWSDGAPWFLLLESFGALELGEPVDDRFGGHAFRSATLTALGHWAAVHLRTELPRNVTADLSAAEVLDLIAGMDPAEAWGAASLWRAERGEPKAAAEFLAAAEHAGARARAAALRQVDSMGDHIRPALEAHRDSPLLGPALRTMLAWWEESSQGIRWIEEDEEVSDAPGGDPQDLLFMRIEQALARWEARGAEDVYTYVWRRFEGADLTERIALLRAGGHPQAEGLIAALEQVGAEGDAQCCPPVLRLKVALKRNPSVWRRVEVPADATLGELHGILRVLMGWGDDHLHVFGVAGRHYADPFRRPEDAEDEDCLELDEAFARAGSARTIAYTYDLGDCWDHRIVLEETLGHPQDSATFPRCTGGRGDNPIEDWNEEYPEEPVPFDLHAVNAALAETFGRSAPA